MPTITQINGKWRALIRLKGLRPRSRYFEQEDEARTWAVSEERAMRAVRNGTDPLHSPCPYRIAGVYGLYLGGELVYVGRSSHVYRRLNDHNRAGVAWDGFRIYKCSDSIRAAELEASLIRRHQPRYNVAMVDERRRLRAA